MIRKFRGRLTALALLLLGGCDGSGDQVQGYVEGDYLRIGLPAPGRVVTLAVEKGMSVGPGDTLFSLDSQAEQAAVAESRARLEQARFQRDNLLTGKRALEIRAIEAQKAQAEASLKLSVVQLRRAVELAKTQAASRSAVDAAQADVDRDRGRVAELTADLAFSREGGRSAEVAAAVAAADAAQAALAQAEWRLGERSAQAPKAARVEDVLYRPGEQVPAGQPVVTLLPPDNVLFRFFLGPDAVGRVANGARLAVACAGCPPALTASVSFVAREASYAPPVIYSRDNRDKLVFLVEARPDAAAAGLHPGQPVTLTLPPGKPAT